MRLLIIEDDRADADYMARAFRELGHSADLATDGEDGLAHAIAGKYGVINVDRRLPKLDGLAVIGACTQLNPALLFDVRFTPDATKLLRSSEMTRCATSGQSLPKRCSMWGTRNGHKLRTARMPGTSCELSTDCPSGSDRGN
jgi:CheY-like chemotaxis protein